MSSELIAALKTPQAVDRSLEALKQVFEWEKQMKPLLVTSAVSEHMSNYTQILFSRPLIPSKREAVARMGFTETAKAMERIEEMRVRMDEAVASSVEFDEQGNASASNVGWESDAQIFICALYGPDVAERYPLPVDVIVEITNALKLHFGATANVSGEIGRYVNGRYQSVFAASPVSFAVAARVPVTLWMPNVYEAIYDCYANGGDLLAKVKETIAKLKEWGHIPVA